MPQIDISDECKKILDDFKKITEDINMPESYSEIIMNWKKMRDEAFTNRRNSMIEDDGF